MEENKDKPIVFAIFGDDKFISWTYGMFTQLVTKPKLYGYSQEQINTCTRNFRSKIKSYLENKKPIDLNEANSVNAFEVGYMINTLNDIATPKHILDNYTNFSFNCYQLNLEYGKSNGWAYPTDEVFEAALNEIDLSNPISSYKYEN